MAKNLVIVESPAKVKTIKKFLGNTYEVVASNGHVRDLPKSTIGIDVDNDYEPKYITIRGKGDVLAKLRKEAKKADKIYLATDPDREGEAISWHLIFALKLEDKKVYRISFNEITKTAVKEAIKNPREIDMNLVDAQQARRALDRIVGYKISPILWAKVKRGLSAGRVQSVALKMVCEREAEIEAFIPEEYWTVSADLMAGKTLFNAKVMSGSKDDGITDEKAALKIKEKIEKSALKVTEVKKGSKTKKAPLPFTTSTLQQEAVKRLNYATQKTMRIAQQLYEGVDIKGEGTVGLITYLRTDSTRISDEAIKASNEFIKEKYGEEYLSTGNNGNKTKSKVQDAHEAIRPTDINRTPAMVKDSLSRDQYRLYQLIYNCFLASRMADAVYETYSLKIKVDDLMMSASSQKMTFAGFRTIYDDDVEDVEEKEKAITSIKEGDVLKLKDVNMEQHFTQSAPHYTDATLVKALEEHGIGRPSTYAPTISTIIARRYITKENKNLYVTELGEIVNHITTGYFGPVVDEQFTAGLEEKLDNVAEGKQDWKGIMREFYPDFKDMVAKADDELDKIDVADELSDEFCPLCNRQLVIKYGPHGKFLACPGFPECKFTKPYLEKIDVKCPKCGKDVVVRRSKKGRLFYGCEDYPNCDFMSWARPSAEKCPQCGKILYHKGNKLICSDEKCGFICEKTEK
ncbi:MAG: type I DNA topoisomerase [Lachnospiraceae bacterium]|nr:type I DNA topoisomerase [Lachnospiraceae bacterium]